VQIARRLETCATCGYMQQDLSCVDHASRLLRIPFCLEENFMFLKTSHFFSLSSSSGLLTSDCYHHPVHFRTSKSLLDEHVHKVRADWNLAEQRARHLIRHPLRPTYNTDTP